MSNQAEWERCRGLDISDDDVMNAADDEFDAESHSNEGKPANSDTNEANCEMCAQSVCALKEQLAIQAQTIADMKQQIEKYANDELLNSDNQSKKRKRDAASIKGDIDLAIVADSADKDIKIQMLIDENRILKDKLSSSGNSQVTQDKPTTFDKSTTAKGRTLPSNPPLASLLSEMEELIEKKFNNLEDKISVIVEKKLDARQIANKEQVKMSFAEALSNNVENKNDCVEKAIKATQNYERVMETERHKREKNIVIHGVETGDSGNQEDYDKQYISSFLEVLGADVHPESFTRLGKPSDASDTNEKKKSRPLRICLKTTDDKDTIMRRLPNLRNADDKYRKVSVKDDYTFEEREIIKEWQELANKKNEEENTDVWKCRGNPKNGMRLIKIKRKTDVIA